MFGGLIRVYCCCVIDVVLLGLVCCTRLIANCNHCLFSELQFASIRVRHLELRPQLIHWSLKYQGVEWSNLQVVFCARFECVMTCPTLCLTLEHWMGSRVQSTIGCFPELCFLQFSVAQVLVGLRKQFIINFIFPLVSVLLVLVIIIIDHVQEAEHNCCVSRFLLGI